MQKTGTNQRLDRIVYKRKHRLLIALAVLFSISPHAQASEPTEDIFDYAFRMRSEHVDIDGNQGAALTTRLRLKLNKELAPNWHASLQLDHVESFFNDRHSDGIVLNGKPVIADPRSTEFNNAYVQFKKKNTEITLGRQTIAFGVHRFVGDVGFRQNDQTFDSVRFQYKALGGWTTNYAYITRVNRPLSSRAGKSLSTRDIRSVSTDTRPTGQLGRHDVDAHLLNIETTFADHIDVSAFAHSVHNHDHNPFSNRTAGVTVDWKYKHRAITYDASVIYAKQQKQQTAVDSQLDFWRLDVGLKHKAWSAEIRQERFGSNSGQAFVTPLATLHKFQGWADQFLSTPSVGLIDSSLRIVWKQRPWTVDYRYHQFKSVASSAGRTRNIGKEHNMDLIFKPTRKHEVKIRLADYTPESNNPLGTVRTRKLFLMFSYGF